MKICRVCNTEKTLNSFTKDKYYKDGYRTICKQCSSEKSKKRKRSKKGLLCTIYSRQIQSSKHRKHPKPKYTKETLLSLYLNDPTYTKLYDSWVSAGYPKNLTPSIDRIDSNKPYTLSNIQLVTWEQNDKSMKEEWKTGKVTTKNKPQKRVLQITKNCRIVAEYVSVNAAHRKTAYSLGGISQACNNGKQFKGYYWKFN